MPPPRGRSGSEAHPACPGATGRGGGVLRPWASIPTDPLATSQRCPGPRAVPQGPHPPSGRKGGPALELRTMEPVAQQRRLTRTGRRCGPSEGEQPRSDRKRVLSAMASATAAALWTGPWGFRSGGRAWEPLGNAGPRPCPRPAESLTGAGQRPGLPGATQQHVTQHPAARDRFHQMDLCRRSDVSAFEYSV